MSGKDAFGLFVGVSAALALFTYVGYKWGYQAARREMQAMGGYVGRTP